MTTTTEQPRDEAVHGPVSAPADFKPQIDSLRALAVLAVMLHHLWPTLPSFGHEGVRLFFVISGYLITRILIAARRPVADGANVMGARFFLLRSFYARRILRLFPAYYVLLVVLSLTAGLGASTWWHFGYISNFWFGLTNDWSPWMTAHFWTLSVEEQFYLLWPLVVLLTPPRRLWVAALVLFAAGPVSRLVLFHMGANDVMLWVATPASFDALAAGALLACAEGLPRTNRVMTWLVAAAALALVLLKLTFRGKDALDIFWADYVWAEMLIALLFAAIVHRVSIGVKGWMGVFLDWRPLRFLGGISYGLYLYHMPCVLVAWKVTERYGIAVPAGLPWFLLVASITVAVAVLSWRLLEAPLNRLKRFFPYTKKPAESPSFLPSRLHYE